ncbi:hypothetical protein LDENG_00246680, partial [Lucifuga dentata]
MGFSVSCSCFAALSFLLCLGGVWCDCTKDKVQIEGGTYSLTKQLQTGSVLIYECPKGFYPYPERSRVCQRNSQWKPVPRRFPPQRCRMVECPDPNVLEYGDVSPPQEKYYVYNETTYECNSGYTLRGSSTRVCLPNGKWSGSTPICSRDTGNHCADPGIPPGASRIGNTFHIDDTVKYSCNGKLYLVGSSVRVCQENSHWTGTEPACYYKHTYDTPLEVSEAFGGAIKQTLTTLESTDDTQEGRKIKITKNGTLNIYIAVDISESIEEEQFKEAKLAVQKLITKISSFAVSPNYEILFFSSDIHEVANIIDFFVGEKQTLPSIMKKLEDFEIGERDVAGTDLNLVFMTFTARLSFIKQRAGDGFKDHRHVFIVFTDGGYNMGGSPEKTVANIKNMVYMNHSLIQERQEYLDIYIFGIGTEIFDDNLQPLTAGTGGLHYFRLQKIQNLQETFDEIIDEEDVKGLCGLHKDYEVNDRDPERKKYPWLAYIVVKNRKCLGSLVTPKFILTAAHCFRFEDLPKDVQVEIDDGRGLVKKVKTFKIHPNYKINAKVDEGVKEFYDYDVALIELQEFVKISTNVRPICIPCTQETNAALKLVSGSTCRQQEQYLLKDHLEKLTFLTKSQYSIDEKDVYAKLGDN